MASAAESPGPHFLGVGPEKTGTSWYHALLEQHPALWLPPVKELRYFWEREKVPDETTWQRLCGSGSWHRAWYRWYFWRRLRHYLTHPWRVIGERARWDRAFLFGRRDERWYRACFQPAAGRLTGEVSPQYFFLRESTVAHIAGAFPGLKVVVTLRQPADWAWSFVKMNVGTGFTADSPAAIAADLEGKFRWARFAPALQVWRRHFPSDRVRVLFFDDLEEDPARFFGDICDFLGIDRLPADTPALARRVNPGRPAPMPDDLRARCEAAWRDDVAELAELVPELPPRWLRSGD